jgi:hypothetical protein
MGEEAVIDLPLGDRPLLDLTDDEAIKFYVASPQGYGKLLKNQARWKAFADKAETVKDGYKKYLREIFSKNKSETEISKSPKKWWQIWKKK